MFKDTEPPNHCPLCPRLKAFRDHWRQQEPSWFNAPVPPFFAKNPMSTKLLIIGLAPGLRGANRTGRPFTGDYAGDLLYATLKKFGFSEGQFQADPQDGLKLIDTTIINAVRCVPPENRPLGAEITTCRQFLQPYLSALPNLRVILALGSIAHQTILRALGQRISQYKFKHGASYNTGKFQLFDSYHCSRYNTNTGRLTAQMFEQVFQDICLFLQKNDNPFQKEPLLF